jgi:hypothetical protein
MQRQLSEIRFYQTYYFANAIRNILHDQFSYLRTLDDFYGDDKYLVHVTPFPKYSALHCFIEFVIDDILSDEVNEIKLEKRQEILRRFSSIPVALEDIRPTSLPISEALNYYEIEHESFEDWLKEHNKTFLEATDGDLSDYYTDLRLTGPYDTLLERAVNEVFFVIFQNRRLLLIFNDMIARQVEDSEPDEAPDEYRGYFASSGVLKRVTIPSWVKRAVFFRDRGFCALCNRDLSGILNISNIEHFDHIVPLAQSGLNDVTNIQLLCQDCNLKKRHHEATTSDYYEAWFQCRA